MDTKKISKYFIEEGILADKEVISLFSGLQDEDFIKILIEKIKQYTGERFLTRKNIEENKEKLKEIILDMPSVKKESLEKLKIKLGLSIEISKFSKKEIKTTSDDKENLLERKKTKERGFGVKILSEVINSGEKQEVALFTQNFRERFMFLKNILQEKSELKNLISINKISNNTQRASIIGLVSDKRTTKNKNIILEVEDLTGRIKVLINKNKEEIYSKAEKIPLDAVMGFTGSGNKEIFFINDLVFPEAKLFQRKKAEEEEYALFLGDVQIGSKIFMKENFVKFIEYLNGEYKIENAPPVEKIKYLFFVGDVVEGVGIFPGQEKELDIKDLEEQYIELAEYLKKIREDITIIISPGNHDGVRLMEPQPAFDEKYAWPIFNLKNVVVTGNPSLVNIASNKTFPGFNVLTYHGFSYPFYADNIPNLSEEGNALNSPEKIMKYLLRVRHLAPTHGSTQYFPLKKDGLLIRNAPDIFVSGHTHKMAVDYYNNILIVSTSAWEEQNKYQERMGNKPDFCKIPAFNLKTRQIQILDFEKIPDPHTKEEAVTEKTISEEVIPKEVIPKEVIPKEVIPKEVIPKEAIPKEAIPKEVIPKEVIPKEVIPKEVISK